MGFSPFPKAHRKVALVLLILTLLVSWYIYYRGYVFPVYLHVFHAGSLTAPFERLAKEFMKTNSRVRIVNEPHGSLEAVRQVTELHRKSDVIGVSDYTVIKDLMFPNYADWYIVFARNGMVIVYGEHSKYRDEINENSWYAILNRSDVSFGRADPDADPCGYRTLMVWKLAEKHYNNSEIYESLERRCPLPTRPKESELLTLIETRQLDYAFLYFSLAVQHQLNYVMLPDEINLGNPDYASFYAQADVQLSDGTVKYGEPIMYAVTIPKNAENKDLAIDFVELMLSEKGRNILNECGQPPVLPARANNRSAVPSALQPYVIDGWN
jgi:molybdate/tungstate transport system substrate-binding protein